MFQNIWRDIAASISLKDCVLQHTCTSVMADNDQRESMEILSENGRCAKLKRLRRKSSQLLHVFRHAYKRHQEILSRVFNTLAARISPKETILNGNRLHRQKHPLCSVGIVFLLLQYSQISLYFLLLSVISGEHCWS